MTLASGSRLGPYEILAPLGAGGMGEVCRVQETRVSHPRRRPRLSRAQRAALKLQGKYMGTMRGLKPRQRAKAQIRIAKGIRAAIRAAERVMYGGIRAWSRSGPTSIAMRSIGPASSRLSKKPSDVKRSELAASSSSGSGSSGLPRSPLPASSTTRIPRAAGEGHPGRAMGM